MSRKLRLSTVPAVVAVVGGKLHWFDKHFSVQNLRDFVRGLYPSDLIQEVLCCFMRYKLMMMMMMIDNRR